MEERKRKTPGEKASAEDSPERTGVFTSGIVSTREGRRIALFFTGRKHAGENLEKVLRERVSELDPPIQMCDGLSRNLPGQLKTIVANCVLHGRRNFVDLTESFPEECRYVLETLKGVYKNEAIAQKNKMSPEDRQKFHQENSGSLMNGLHEWLQKQFDEKKVEPNSGLGEAISYMLNRWEKLTLFLRKPGAPIDNNTCERALKKAILFRKNSLFYKTQNGAHVGDVLMSIIYTCQLCGANPFDYLNELQRHADELAQKPSEWMPWNYREKLAKASGT